MSRPPDISPLSQLIRRVDAITDGARPPDSVPTGFPSVDRILGGGFRRGDLIALGGDVGSGKSALALAVALRVAQEDRPTAFFSGEMSVNRLLERAVAIEGRAKIDDIRRGNIDDFTRAGIGAAALRLRDHGLALHCLPAAGGIRTLTEEIRQLAGSGGVVLVVIDPLTCLARGLRDVERENATAVRRLKALAVELDIAILVTAHLPGFVRARPDPRPQLEDFGAVGAIKQHADVVLALFREEMYEDARSVEGATELLVRKNRNGVTGYVDLYFYKQWMRFEDMLDPDR